MLLLATRVSAFLQPWLSWHGIPLSLHPLDSASQHFGGVQGSVHGGAGTLQMR